MKNTVTRAAELLQNEGVTGLLHGVGRFVYWKFGVRTLHLNLKYLLHTGDSVDITINGEQYRFYTSNKEEFIRSVTLMNEREILSDIAIELEEGDNFLDVGANTGIYSIVASKNADAITVDAVEPHPSNIDAMKKNFEINGCSVNIHEIALSNESGTAELIEAGEGAGFGEHALATAEGESTDRTVETAKLDNLVAKGVLNQPNVIKIDIEGAELNAIRGSQDTLSNPSCRLVYCEVHPDRLREFGGSYEELMNEFESLGFSVDVIEGEIDEYAMLKATKSPK